MEFLQRLGARVAVVLAPRSAEEGQALVEYALLLTLLAVVCVGAVEAFGLNVASLYSKINADWP
jgi:Flp pilus assembly pilin Flp